MAFVLKFAKTVRRNWKKSIFFTAVTIYGAKYAKTKYEEDLLRREYCAEARKYGLETIPLGRWPRKITVFLNPAASVGKGSKLFEKNAAPLLYLAGVEVNVVKTEYEGQVKQFLTVLETTDTDAVVVAGGDGTLLEVITGMMRKENKKFRQTIPVGVIPLGATNRFAQLVFGTDLGTVKIIADSTMAVIRGITKKMDVVKIQSEDGRTSFALSGMEMGAFRDAEERKIKYWYFGPLKSRWTYVRTAMKTWPPVLTADIEYIPTTEEEASAVKTKRKKPVEKKSSWSWLNIFYKPKVIAENLDEEEDDEDLDDPGIQMISERLSTVELTVLSSNLQDQTQKQKPLLIGIGPSSPKKMDLMKEGWRRIKDKSLKFGTETNRNFFVKKIKFTPVTEEGNVEWMNIDGERFEVMPFEMTLLKNRLKVFYNSQNEKS